MWRAQAGHLPWLDDPPHAAEVVVRFLRAADDCVDATSEQTSR